MIRGRLHERGIERISAFGDGVFAIAITLLVLEIKLPETLAGRGEADLPDRLLATGPHLLAIALSFVVIGTYWLSHLRVMYFVQRYNSQFVYLTLLYLLCVTFVPFPTSVLAEHGEQAAAVIFYAASMAAAGLASTGLWLYSTRGHRLIDAHVNPRLIRYYAIRRLVVPFVFLVSIPISFVSPTIAEVTWFSIAPLLNALGRLFAPEQMELELETGER